MQLELDFHGKTLSECCEKMNNTFEASGKELSITNRQLKNFLINKFGGEICFSYSKKINESQM